MFHSSIYNLLIFFVCECYDDIQITPVCICTHQVFVFLRNSLVVFKLLTNFLSILLICKLFFSTKHLDKCKTEILLIWPRNFMYISFNIYLRISYVQNLVLEYQSNLQTKDHYFLFQKPNALNFAFGHYFARKLHHFIFWCDLYHCSEIYY